MAVYGPGLDFTLVSEVDASAAQYRIAIPQSGTSFYCKIASQAPEITPIIGVYQNKPQSGYPARIRFVGISKVIAGGTIETGDPLNTNGTGFAVKGNSAFMLGTALSDAASGAIFTAFVNPGQSIA